MNLSALNVAELRALQQEVVAELKQREVQERDSLRKELQRLAEARGFSLDELFAGDGKQKEKTAAGRKVKIKYRHPLDAGLSWTGRGRKPKWVESWLAEGGNLDALLVA